MDLLPKTRRGFWIRFYFEAGTHDITGITTEAELYYRLTKYHLTPNIKCAKLFIGLHEIGPSIPQEDFTMSKLSEYRAENPLKSGRRTPNIDQKANPEYRQKAGPGKEFLVKSRLPFTISDAGVEAHGKYDYMDYTIEFVQCPRFEQASSFAEIERGPWILSLPASEERSEHYDNVLLPFYVETGQAVVLVRDGNKPFDFAEYDVDKDRIVE